jgi:hypothetical protein
MSIPFTETGHAKMKRSSCSRAISANSKAAMAVKSFMSFVSSFMLEQGVPRGVVRGSYTAGDEIRLSSSQRAVTVGR